MLPSGYEWLVLLLVVVLVFGTKKLKNVGGDLGSAVKSFKKAMAEDETSQPKGEKEKETQKLQHDENADDAVFDVKPTMSAKDHDKS